VVPKAQPKVTPLPKRIPDVKFVPKRVVPQEKKGPQVR
jgi:hypothetical protein